MEQILPSWPSEGTNPALSWPPELGDNTFLLWKPVFVVLSCGSPSQLRRAVTPSPWCRGRCCPWTLCMAWLRMLFRTTPRSQYKLMRCSKVDETHWAHTFKVAWFGLEDNNLWKAFESFWRDSEMSHLPLDFTFQPKGCPNTDRPPWPAAALISGSRECWSLSISL